MNFMVNCTETVLKYAEYGAGFARESYDRSFRFVLQLDRLS